MSNVVASETWWRCADCAALVARAVRPVRCPDCRAFSSLRATDERPKPRIPQIAATSPAASSLRDPSGRFLPRGATPRAPQRIVAVPPRPALNAAPLPPIEIATTAPEPNTPTSIEVATATPTVPAPIVASEDPDDPPEDEEDRVYRASEVEDEEYMRVPTGSSAFDHFLGGGACIGHTYVFAGAPGIGKTTRLVEAAACIAAQQGWLALYVCGEEPKEDVKRTLRESGVFDRYPNAADNFCLYETQDPDRAVERADEIGAKIVVVDSMSVMRSLKSSPGEDAQYKYAATSFYRRSKAIGPHKKKEKITIFGVGQVNQDGSMGGPNRAIHWISFAGMVEIVDPNTLLPAEDQTRPTGTTGWRVYKGKSRGSSNTRTCYFDRDDETGIVTERPAGSGPGVFAPAPKPRPDRVVQRAGGLQEASPVPRDES